ncbi:MAG: hypothetical protein LBQ10_11615 [Desulfovibrio sp.]|jgi:hypothetical protein|nr:hypothetical protein [Desulfovibrio sp.]
MTRVFFANQPCENRVGREAADVDAKHPKNGTLRWTAETLYKLIEKGEKERARPEEAEGESGHGILRGEILPDAQDIMPDAPAHPFFDRGRQPVHDMFSVADEVEAANEGSPAFGSSLAASAPDGLADGTEFVGGEGDDSLFGDGVDGYLFSSADAPYPDGEPGGSLYGGVGDDAIVYNPSDAAGGGADIDFLLVKEPDGAKIDNFRLKIANAEDEETPGTDVIIYGEDVAGLTSLKALADIGVTVDGGRISVDDHDSWMWGRGNSHGEYTTFTGSDKEGHRLILDVLTEDLLKKIGTAE